MGVACCCEGPAKVAALQSKPVEDRSTEEGLLSDQELATVQKIWRKVLEDVDGNGKVIFSKLFKERDVIQKFSFAVANNGNYDRTMNDARLIWHIRRVFATMTYIIERLKDEKSVIEKIQWAGAVHAKYRLTDLDFGAFKRAVLATLKEAFGASFTSDKEEAWKKVLDFLTCHMKVGVLNELNSNPDQKSTEVDTKQNHQKPIRIKIELIGRTMSHDAMISSVPEVTS